MTTKHYATASIKALDDDGGYDFESILSVPTLDRDGEIIDGKAFEPLPEHITIDVDHAMTVERTVASGQPFYEGDALMFRGTFASTPLGQLTRTLVKEGHIRTMSVAFMNARVEVDPDDERPHIRQAELLNAAIVAIPSNREALIGAVKSLAEDIADPDAEVKAIDDTNAALKAAEAAGHANQVAYVIASVCAQAATIEVLRP